MAPFGRSIITIAINYFVSFSKQSARGILVEKRLFFLPHLICMIIYKLLRNSFQNFNTNCPSARLCKKLPKVYTLSVGCTNVTDTQTTDGCDDVRRTCTVTYSNVRTNRVVQATDIHVLYIHGLQCTGHVTILY